MSGLGGVPISEKTKREHKWKKVRDVIIVIIVE